MSTQRINFPRLGFRHITPELDLLSIIGCTREQRERRMVTGPIDSTIVSFQYVLDNNIVGTKQFGLYRNTLVPLLVMTHARRMIQRGGGGFPHLLVAKNPWYTTRVQFDRVTPIRSNLQWDGTLHTKT